MMQRYCDICGNEIKGHDWGIVQVIHDGGGSDPVAKYICPTCEQRVRDYIEKMNAAKEGE